LGGHQTVLFEAKGKGGCTLSEGGDCAKGTQGATDLLNLGVRHTSGGPQTKEAPTMEVFRGRGWGGGGGGESGDEGGRKYNPLERGKKRPRELGEKEDRSKTG